MDLKYSHGADDQTSLALRQLAAGSDGSSVLDGTWIRRSTWKKPIGGGRPRLDVEK